MNGKRILVTGAASGMGAATAGLLLERGVSIVAVDRDAAGLRRLADGNGDVTTIELDLSDADAIARELGDLELDGVANIAGLGPDSDAVRLSFQVNLLAPLRVLEAVRSGLRPGAGVVNVASIVGGLSDDRLDGLLANPMREGFLDEVESEVSDGAMAYTYSKRAVVHESERLALEWAPDVRINIVSPGLVDTPLGARSMELPWTKKLSARIPLQRHAQPEEVGRAIVFLLGDDAGYLTGVDIAVDGGYMTSQRQRQRPAAAAC